MAAASARAAISDGLIFYAPFEGASANDVQGAREAVPGGSPEFIANGGIIGSFVKLANDTVLPETYIYWPDPTPDTDSFSVQFWVRSANLRNGQASGDPALLANKNWGSGGNPGWVVALGAGGDKLQWNFRSSVGSRADFDPVGANAVLGDGAWHHFVMTHDRTGDAVFYVDGGEIGRVNISGGAGGSIRVPGVDIMALGTDNTLSYENGNGSTANGDFDEVAMWNRVLVSGEVVRIYNAGRQGIGVRDIPDPTTPFVSEMSPRDGASGVGPQAAFRAVITDAGTQLNPASVRLYLDGQLVSHTATPGAGGTTVSYTPPALKAPLSSHSYELVFSDNGFPVVTKTNKTTFTVVAYLNVLLPPPIVLETFDSVAEGELPVGWTATNATSSLNGVLDLNDPLSDSYLNWTVISSNRLFAVFGQNRLGVTTVATNGTVVPALMNGNLVYAESDNRGGSQLQVLMSPDFDLTGHTNVYLSFNSIYAQNQDSFGGVEYSVDEGITWHPVLYMVDRDDIILDANGQVDAVATLNTDRGDQAFGLAYNTGVLAPITPDLAPYISGRVNDDQIESKRVEFFRLPLADNQPRVRLRFVQSGTASWYFGLDDVGLYSITQVSPPVATVQPGQFTEAVGNTVRFSVDILGIGPFTYQWQRDGRDLPGATSASLPIFPVRPEDAGQYSVNIGYLGGITNSSAARLTVIPPAQALVSGQWDFVNFDLSATCGLPLEYSEPTVEIETGLTTSDFYGLPDLDGAPVPVMAFPGNLPGGVPMSGYRMRHGLAANGGGTNVNKYTLIMDVLYPSSSHNVDRGLLQTDPANSNNRDIAIGANNGIGVSGGFQGVIAADVWQRIAFAVDLSGPSPTMAKFINGTKVGQQVLSEGRDGRWSLRPANDPTGPWALLFADDTAEIAPGFVSSIQIRGDRLSDELIARMGGPSRHKIPGCITVSRQGANTIVRWTGGVPLESAPAVTGPWSEVVGATSPYTVPASSNQRFFRPKL
ncbi:MAG TPA: LamG-like jellyroll fold domain-containing protein [Methylomirabilota bacterium]|nr:LamG-like jellyroll fold domain-containing protein [Methylomirabilota bacterium]